jgi:hypothetical protein
MVNGLVKPQSGTVTTLPSSCRPTKRLIFNLNCDKNTVRVDVLPSGKVIKVAGTARTYLNLNGIVFAVKNSYALRPQNSWTNYGGSYGSISYTRSSGGICEAEGLVRGIKWGQAFATLPSACRPKKRLVFNLNNHQYSARVDVLQNGQIAWISGGKTHGWMSLSGIVFSTRRGTPLRVMNGWKNFGGAYGRATVRGVNNVCFMSGVLRGTSAKWGSVMAKLPKSCQPRRRMMFNVNEGKNAARLDVLPNGNVVWISALIDPAEWKKGRRHFVPQFCYAAKKGCCRKTKGCCCFGREIGCCCQGRCC